MKIKSEDKEWDPTIRATNAPSSTGLDVGSDAGTLANPVMGPMAAIPVTHPLNSATIREQRRLSIAPPTTHQTQHTEENDAPLFMQVRPLDSSFANPMSHSSANAVEGEDVSFMQFKTIGIAVKACNDTLAQLQQLGISEVVSLPELVLVGDQSSGKSSLMSSIGDLSLPRSEGVCTRCPIHIKLSSSTEWSAKISLIISYAFQPPANGNLRVTANNKFPPWVPQAREIHEFKVLDKEHKSQIEDCLRWAQIALLSPRTDRELFIPGVGHIANSTSPSEQIADTPAKFSPNIISLEIKGPGLPDLSFYDLPGLIRSTANEEDTYLVKVVENLAREYMQHPNALIIWAVPMTMDPDNSQTFQVIRDMKVANRTVGVMTKADLLQRGDHTQWLRMLRGDPNYFAVGLGYYVTSRPSQVDREDLVRWEEGFFSRSLDGNSHIPISPWPGVFDEFHYRTGVHQLRKFVSERLSESFTTSLPTIKTRILEQMNSVVAELTTLPELPSNVEHEVRMSLSRFVDLVKKDIQSPSFSSSWQSVAHSFRNCIIGMKPRFTITDPSDSRAVIEIQDSDDDGNTATVPVTTTPMRKRQTAGDPNSHADAPASQRRRLENSAPVPGSGASVSGNPIVRNNMNMPTGLTQPSNRPDCNDLFALYGGAGRGFMSIRDIRHEIDANAVAGLPDVINTEVYRSIAMRAVSKWDGPLGAFIAGTMKQLRWSFETSLQQALSSMHQRIIFKEIIVIIQKHLQHHERELQDLLKRLLRYEQANLYTTNSDMFKQYHDSEASLLRQNRHYWRWRAFTGGVNVAPLRLLETMSGEERDKQKKHMEKEVKTMGPDQWDKEIGVAAYVRGYYMTTACGFSDVSAKSIHNGLIMEITNDLNYHLENELGLINNSGSYDRLMEEDEAIGRKRRELRTMKVTLDRAIASIVQLEANSAQ